MAYGVNDQGYIDYDQVRDLAKKHRPRMLLAGASAYPRTIDFKTFADIAHEVGGLSVCGYGPISPAWWLWGSTPPRCPMPT